MILVFSRGNDRDLPFDEDEALQVKQESLWSKESVRNDRIDAESRNLLRDDAKRLFCVFPLFALFAFDFANLGLEEVLQPLFNGCL